VLQTKVIIIRIVPSLMHSTPKPVSSGHEEDVAILQETHTLIINLYYEIVINF
jgi:hypothetical protein